MPSSFLNFALLLVAAFGLTTWLEPRFQDWAGNQDRSSDALAVLLGDSRRLFARHFYLKADAYLHSGYYPSIFDERDPSEKLHLAGNSAGGPEGDSADKDALGPPKDWIDRFSRHFYPSSHSHLGEGKSSPGQENQNAGEERELLPWLRLAAELDPQLAETYVVGSYWMRSHLGEDKEAEQYLREGLHYNPGNPEILFELGRIYRENRKDPIRSRNIWELALNKWRELEQPKAQPNLLLYEQLLGSLAKLEEEQKQYSKAIEYLQLLKEVSPSKQHIQKWIGELQTKPAS